MSHSLDARLHLILVASKRSALLDAGSLFLTTPDRVIVSYKIEWRAFLFVDIYFYFFCHTWFSLSSIVLLRRYLSLFNTAWVMLMYTGIQHPRLFISETKHWVSLGFSTGWPGDHSSWFLCRTDWFLLLLLFFWVGWGGGWVVPSRLLSLPLI